MENIKTHIVRLNHSHTAELNQLYKIIFKKKVTSDYFHKKYGLFDPAIPNYSHSLLDDGKVVGFFGTRIVTYQMDNKIISVPQTGDYFILDEYRGMGLFQKLYNTVLNELRKNKFEVACAFHSEQTYKISQGWGWKDSRHLLRFHIMSSPRIVGKLVKTFGLDNWRFKRFKKTLEPFITQFNLTELNKTEDKFCAIFDDDFYRTKEFTEHFQITISDCTVWLKWQGNLSIGFIHFHPGADIPNFIQIVKRLTKNACIHETVIHIQEGTKEALELRKFITPKPSFKVSTLHLNDNSGFDFERVKLNLMEKDIF